MNREIDFTGCPRVPARAYNGANGKKVAVWFEEGVWLLKFPPSASEKPTELSYSNSSYSEHVGSTVFRLLGVDAQETRLGIHFNGRRKVVCACRDFTVPGKRLLDFCSIKNSVIDSESGGTGTELEDVLASIRQQQFVDPVVVLRRFWEMFVVDAFLGNFDRHNGNWGFLADEADGTVGLAPVFDCGSCLLPQADAATMEKVLASEDELNARIYAFPGSMLKLNGRKINYRDFIQSSVDADFRAALNRLVPMIRALDIDSLLADVPFMSSLQHDFLFRYMSARRDRLF